MDSLDETTVLTTFPQNFNYLVPLGSFIVTLLGLAGILKSGFAKIALDRPNQRSLHAASVPRTGGLALMVGTFSGWGFLLNADLGPLLIFSILLMAASFLDDLFSVQALWRFVAHIMAAGGFVVVTLGLSVGYVAVFLATIAIVWMINLYNFMDGSDGLAGGMACFGFGFYALAAWFAGDAWLTLASLSVVGAALAFLLFNFYPAKIFMGDAGSVPLGFLAAALGLLGWQHGDWPLWFPGLVFAPFIMDASVTLMKRLSRREKVWQAHREHYYQRLVQMGWGHRNTALFEYGLMAGCGLSAILALGQSTTTQVAVILGWAISFGVLMLIADNHWAKFTRLNPKC